MRFLESFIAATAAVFLIPLVNGTAGVITGDEYCQALTQLRASRCDSNDLCTLENGMDPKDSCSQSTIAEATRIYQENIGGTLPYGELRHIFSERYEDFLSLSHSSHDVDWFFSWTIRSYLNYKPENMNLLQPILNMILYIPCGNVYDDVEITMHRSNFELRKEVAENMYYFLDHAYAIAVLDMIGVPDDLIRYTVEENLWIELRELYEYTTLSNYMVFSIEERLHLFELIKRFHERGLTTDPRFPKTRLAIVYSLLKIQEA